MTIKDSTLDGNRGIFYGGALEINQQVTVFQSTIAGNKAGDSFGPTGAAAEIQGGATPIVSDSTVAGNTTQPPGRGRSTISAGA